MDLDSFRSRPRKGERPSWDPSATPQHVSQALKGPSKTWPKRSGKPQVAMPPTNIDHRIYHENTTEDHETNTSSQEERVLQAPELTGLTGWKTDVDNLRGRNQADVVTFLQLGS